MLFSIFFRRKSFFKEMTDLAKSYIFDLILYREDKLIILGINFDQYLIFFFGTGFVCIVDQGSNNLDQVVFRNAGNDFFVPHADIGPDIFRRTDNFTVDKSCQDFIANLQKGEILPAVIFSAISVIYSDCFATSSS